MLEGKVFVDSNILLYAFDVREPSKQAQAQEWLTFLWENTTGRLSWQVLNEFYVNAVNKIKINRAAARELVGIYKSWDPLSTGMATIERAWYWMDKAQTSFWDSQILAAAEQLECVWLLSEDFQPGRKYESVTIVNPFEPLPSTRAKR